MKKNNLITIFLIVIIFVLIGLSFFIVSEIQKTDTAIKPTIQTKAAAVTYKKELALNTITSTPIPTVSLSVTKEPTVKLLAQGGSTGYSVTPTPTGIQLLTTPIVTQESSRKLLVENISPTSTASSYVTKTASQTATKVPVKTLPSAGIYNMTLVMFFAAITLIFFSFIL